MEVLVLSETEHLVACRAPIGIARQGNGDGMESGEPAAAQWLPPNASPAETKDHLNWS